MNDYISLSTLNDFIFCPYSIYLHNVYMETADDMYTASPQANGKLAHRGVDNKTGSSNRTDILSLPVYSDELGISGVIDVYKSNRRLLIERKNNLKNIYRGQIYQLWGQYYCMKEMGYQVDSIAFYEISTNKMIPLELPNEESKSELLEFIEKFKSYNPSDQFVPNINKCIHCIYSNLCDKTNVDNVYA